MVKSMTKMGLSMMTPEERKEWLERIQPEKHTLDGSALAELVHLCVGMAYTSSLSPRDIAEWKLALSE